MRFLLVVIGFLVAGCAHQPREPDEEDIRVHPDRFVLVTFVNAEGEPAVRAGSTPREYGPMMQYAVAPRTRAMAREIEADYRLTPVREWPITQLDVHCVVYRLDAGETQDGLLRRLRSDARVESAQPLNSFSTYGSVYNDPYAQLQRNLDTMGVPQAHALSRGRGVSVAVIDTAVDVKHQDLARSNITSRSFTRQREPAAAHGTAVAGIIAATDGNHLGIVGVAPEAKIHALAACWPSATKAARAVCDSFTLAAALASAIELKADIVNLSLGGPSDPLLRRLVDYGIARQMMFVAALPESGVASGFPSEIPGVVIADAVGRNHDTGNVLRAPGTDVLTLVPNDGYDFVSGSSMAAASVSGSLALLLSKQPKAHGLGDVLARSAAPGDSINVCVALAGAQAAQQCATDRSPSLATSIPSRPTRVR